MKSIFLALLAASLTGVLAFAADDAPPNPQLFKHRITGLFSKDREADLRFALQDVPGVELVSVDFDYAEGTFRYDPTITFRNSKPDEVEKAFNQKLGQASNYTLGIQPLILTPHEKLARVTIPIAGLDCKACCLAAYESVFKVEGVCQATASFKQSELTALIDPAKTDRAALEEVMKKKNIKLKTPDGKPAP